MPELPEVETTVRMLRPRLLGRTFNGLLNDWPRQIDRPDFNEFENRLKKRRVKSVERRGKYIIIVLDHHENLLIHLKMTGHLSIASASEPNDPYVHTTFILEGGEQLRFRDARKFGRVYLVHEIDDIVGNLGIEPLESAFTEDLLRQMLLSRNRVLKPLLLDQEFIAGLGNIYVDEALHEAAILPNRSASSLTKDESILLHRSIRSVLRKAIERNGSTIDSYRTPDGSSGDMQNSLKVYGRAGEECQRCGFTIERVVVGGRGTHFCPSCQK